MKKTIKLVDGTDYTLDLSCMDFVKHWGLAIGTEKYLEYLKWCVEDYSKETTKD